MGFGGICFQQLVQKLVYIVAVLSHTAGQHIVGCSIVSQQLGTLQTEVHELLHDVRIVEFVVVRALGVVCHV